MEKLHLKKKTIGSILLQQHAQVTPDNLDVADQLSFYLELFSKEEMVTSGN